MNCYGRIHTARRNATSIVGYESPDGAIQESDPWQVDFDGIGYQSYGDSIGFGMNKNSTRARRPR